MITVNTDHLISLLIRQEVDLITLVNVHGRGHLRQGAALSIGPGCDVRHERYEHESEEPDPACDGS